VERVSQLGQRPIIAGGEGHVVTLRAEPAGEVYAAAAASRLNHQTRDCPGGRPG